jgi:hypothetical protein
MLKLERDKQTHQVTIQATKSNRLFTNLFVTALIIAVSLHLAFFLVFRIDKGHENYPDLILPPVTVHVIPHQAGSPEHYTLTDYEAQALAKKSQYEPQPSQIIIPPISQMVQTTFTTSEIHTIDYSIFRTLETEYLLKEHYPLVVSIPTPRITLHISGPLSALSTKEPIHSIFEEVIDIPFDHLEQLRHTFDVIVDNATGKIMWYEKQEEPQYEHETIQPEDILLALSFEPDTGRLITRGHIEVITTSIRKYDND